MYQIARLYVAVVKARESAKKKDTILYQEVNSLTRYDKSARVSPLMCAYSFHGELAVDPSSRSQFEINPFLTLNQILN